MALPNHWLEPEQDEVLDMDDEATRARRGMPYIVHHSLQDEEHRIEVRDEIRKSGTTWAFLGGMLLVFALQCLIFYGQEVRAGRYEVRTTFWASVVLGCAFMIFGLLRKRTRV